MSSSSSTSTSALDQSGGDSYVVNAPRVPDTGKPDWMLWATVGLAVVVVLLVFTKKLKL
jgi:hypothetical protein